MTECDRRKMILTALLFSALMASTASALERDLPANLLNKSFTCYNPAVIVKVQVNPPKALLTVDQQRYPLTTVLTVGDADDWEFVSGPEDHQVVMRKETGSWIYYDGLTQYDCRQTK